MKRTRQEGLQHPWGVAKLTVLSKVVTETSLQRQDANKIRGNDRGSQEEMLCACLGKMPSWEREQSF